MSEEDWNESDEPDPAETYLLSRRDRSLVTVAIALLEKIARAGFTRPAELVSVAKPLHLLKRLPQVTDAKVVVRVSLNGPRRWFGEHEIWHWWTVEINNQHIQICSGGHFYRKSTGGDSFTCFNWSAEPGEEAEYSNYLDQMRIVDDAQPFPLEVAALDLSEPGFSLDIEDQGNPFLEEMSVSDAGDDGSGSPENGLDNPATEAEKALAELADEEKGRRLKLTWAGEPDPCGGCGDDHSEGRFFVDGPLRSSPMWTCLCADCFAEQGDGIGWGVGQLYKRQPNGEWLLVAGFPPEKTKRSRR